MRAASFSGADRRAGHSASSAPSPFYHRDQVNPLAVAAALRGHNCCPRGGTGL